jgi:TonB family protein
MGTPSPELKQLWIRVLKRVHPDLAVDEQDRIRCERLTKLANEAYHAGNVEALRAVLSPPNPLMYFLPWTQLSLKQLLPAAIAGGVLIWGGFSLYSVTTSPQAVANIPTVQADSTPAPTKAHVEMDHSTPSKWYEDEIHSKISRNLNTSKVVNTPVGATAVIAFTISREGSPQGVSLFSSSGYPSLDYSCVNAVGQVKTFGPPEGGTKESLSVRYDCAYHPQDVRPAPQERSATVAESVETSEVEPSHLYMEQMAERLRESFTVYERVDASVPAGNTAETWFDVNRDGSLSNVRVGKPSGWDSLDYACVRAVQRAGTVGALPEDYTRRTLPASFACTYNGSNAAPVDSANDRSDLYVGSVRNTTP